MIYLSPTGENLSGSYMGVLIGISGVACSGKDTAANFLVDEFGFVSISFADPIKRACAEIFDWDEETLWGPSENRNKPDRRYPSERIQAIQELHRKGKVSDDYLRAEEEKPDAFLTPRYALQRFGTEFGRHCYSDIWVEYGIRVAKKITNGRGLRYSKSKGIYHYDISPTTIGGVVFPDCRFKNEIRLIKEADGILIRIKRFGAGLEGEYAKHPSEAEQLSIPDSEFDFILDNSGTIEDLKREVVNIGQTLELAIPTRQQLELPWK